MNGAGKVTRKAWLRAIPVPSKRGSMMMLIAGKIEKMKTPALARYYEQYGG